MEKCVRSFECRPLISSAFNTECESFSWFSSYHFHLVSLFFLPSVLPRHAMPMGRGEGERQPSDFFGRNPAMQRMEGRGQRRKGKLLQASGESMCQEGHLKRHPWCVSVTRSDCCCFRSGQTTDGSARLFGQCVGGWLTF